MKLAFLYAGQGSQHPGMGQDLYETEPTFRAVFDAATEELPFDAKSLCFTDPDGLLGQTQYTQPCMVAFAAAMTALLRERGLAPDCLAGLSLGEYSALHAAGVMDAKTAVSLVAYRGAAMASAAYGKASGMSAVLGLDASTLQVCCDQAATQGVVQICNYNCTGQIVIGGEKQAVDACAALAKEAGAKRCLPLSVSGPFHTALMRSAGDALAERFETLAFASMQTPVLFNTLGREKEENQSIGSLLVQQVQSSVQMEATIQRLAALGVDTVIEIGPGKVLSGFVKKTVGSAITCYPVETAVELVAAISALKGA
ncbi:MAG: ACP S-malonyltransferase [Faecalibacterium sp.]